MSIQTSKIRFARSNRAHVLGASILVAIPLATSAAMAQSESVIYSFPTSSAPYGRPWEDPTGAFFAPTYYGSQYGTVAKISEDHGVWKGQTIFTFSGSDGRNPAAGVITDSNGVVYGMTQYGGAYGFGAAYSLTKINGVWTENVLYSFTGGADGAQPATNLVRDKTTGALYGAALSGGGSSGCGTIFSLVPSGGNWTFNVLYSFAGGTDGCTPEGTIHGGPKKGTYFGVTFGGGTGNRGTVFELTENNAVWSESVIHSFAGRKDGSRPEDMDIDIDTGNMFGVTSAGGKHKAGVVFELSQSNHSWKQSVLYDFTGGADGSAPIGIHLDTKTGTLFGTTTDGGSAGKGTVFGLANNGAAWTETVLHSFGTTTNDGAYPESRLAEDMATGVLYGTTPDGGQYGGGTLYAVVP